MMEWTPRILRSLVFTEGMMFFTERCVGCAKDMVLSAETVNDVVVFSCPQCKAIVPGDTVQLLDTDTLREKWGWHVKEHDHGVDADNSLS